MHKITLPERVTIGKALFILWRLAVILTVIVFVFPEKLNSIRYATVGGMFCVWAGALVLWPRVRAVRIVASLAAVLVAVVAFAPGRRIDPLVLRNADTRALVAYEGAHYLWGGESTLGIDCSGLMRRGAIDAYLAVGTRTLNPAAFREAFRLYWLDCSAMELGQGYGGRTQPVEDVESIDEIKLATLKPGDMATVEDGAHILAYLGNATWIDADPRPMRVERVHVPAPGNPWFTIRAHVIRWRAME